MTFGPDMSWRGYLTKAAFVLACLERGGAGCEVPGGGSIPRDGNWYRLGRMYNVGYKLLVWMVENGLLERRDYGGNGHAAVMDAWYRRPGDPDPDLDDFWVAYAGGDA